MARTAGSSSERDLFARVTRLLLDAGYVEVVRETGSHAQCDALAFGRKSDGTYGVAAVVEMKSHSDKLIRQRVAPNILLAKNKFEADSAFLITDSEIWIANDRSLSLEQTMSIPAISRDAGVVRSTKLAIQLIWNHLISIRGKMPIEAGLEALVYDMEVSKGLVTLPGSKVQIEGPTYLNALVEVFSKSSKISRIGMHMSSNSINKFYSLLSAWFPNAIKIFDPTAGAGGSLAIVAQGIADRIGGSSNVQIQGFDISSEAVALAHRVSSLNDPRIQANFDTGDLVTSVWPTCDLLISEPPLGLQLDPRYRAENFNVRTLEEFVVLKTARGLLAGDVRDGAIIITTRGWLTRESSQNFREFLANSGLVRALIGVEGLNPQTAVPLLGVVLGHGTSESLIADLSSDWESQLSGEVGEFSDLLQRSFGY